MAFSLFGRKEKVKPEIKRIEVSEYGEPKYIFRHVPTLEVFREYNLTVSQNAIERDKKLKRIFGLIMAAVAVWFAVLSVTHFDRFDDRFVNRSFFEWVSYSGFMFYFLVFLMAGYLAFHLLTYYRFFDKRLAKATADYYKSSKYLTNEIVLAVYEEGVLEKAEPRDEFFDWEMFNRCWESENVVYIEFNLANQLFVSKEVILEAGIDKDEFMAFCNEKIEIAKKIMAAREEREDEIEELEEKLDELHEEIEELDKDDEDYEKDLEEINAEMSEIEEKLSALKNMTLEEAEAILAAKKSEEEKDDDDGEEDEKDD